MWYVTDRRRPAASRRKFHDAHARRLRGSTEVSVWSFASLTLVSKTEKTRVSSGVGSASIGSTWSPWHAKTTSSKRSSARPRARTVTPAASRDTRSMGAERRIRSRYGAVSGAM